MTVAELIHQLQQFRPDAKVEIEIAVSHGIDSEYLNPKEVVMYNDISKPVVTVRTFTPSPYDANIYDDQDDINYLTW